jgi:hypothetical protein
MTKTDSYFVNLGHAIIDYLLKLVGGKALRDKIGHVSYVIQIRDGVYRREEMGTVVHNEIHHQSHLYHICYMSYFVSQCLATDQFQ